MCLIPWARIDGKASKVRFVGVVKQVNRRIANARRDVLESFTVEHRLHRMLLSMVCGMEQAFPSVLDGL